MNKRIGSKGTTKLVLVIGFMDFIHYTISSRNMKFEKRWKTDLIFQHFIPNDFIRFSL